MNRKQNGNRVTIENMSTIGDLTVECYEVRDGVEIFVGHNYPGAARAWREAA